MSAPAVGGDRPTLRIRGTEYPVLLPTLRDPRLHLASIIITLQVLGQVAFDFQLSIAQILISLGSRRDPRGRDRLQEPPRADVARERTPDGERRRVRPPRSRHGARRLVEHEGVVDLRRHVRGRTAVEVPDPRSRTARLQPVELRPRALLPAPRRRARGSARAVVGAVVARARRRARADRRRRLPHPPAAPPRRDRGRLLARVRGGHRRARRERSHDDGRLACGADRGRGVLVAPRHLARDPRLPLLHDHRPEDDSRERGYGDAPTRSASGFSRPC